MTTQAAAIGRIVAQGIAGEAAFLDMTPLRIERFARDAGHAERLVV